MLIMCFLMIYGRDPKSFSLIEAVHCTQQIHFENNVKEFIILILLIIFSLYVFFGTYIAFKSVFMVFMGISA